MSLDIFLEKELERAETGQLQKRMKLNDEKADVDLGKVFHKAE